MAINRERMTTYGVVFAVLLLLGLVLTRRMPAWIGWPLIIALAAYLNWKAIRRMLR